MRAHQKAAVLLLLATFGAACSKSEQMTSESVAAPAADQAATRAMAAPEAGAAPGSPQGAPPPANAPQAQSRKLIRRLDIALVVQDTEDTANRLQQLADSMGGYVSDLSASRDFQSLRYQMTLRVPAEKLDAARAEIRKLALRVEREQISTEDVTGQFVDLEARVRSLRLTEDELRELLAESRERARKVDEVMSIYAQLTEVRTQIEQIQGQLNQMQGLVSLSTIQLTLESDAAAKPIVEEGAWRPGTTVRNAFRNLVEFLQGFVDLLIVAVINVIPALLVILVPVVLLVKAWKRWRRRRASDERGEETRP